MTQITLYMKRIIPYMQRIILWLLITLLALPLCGCRQRIISKPGTSETPSSLNDSGSGQSGTHGHSAGVAGDSELIDNALPPETHIEALIDPTAEGAMDVAGAAQRKSLHVRTDEPEQNRVTLDEISTEGGETRPADEGGTVGMIMDEYTQLLTQGLGTLYECQMIYLYLEQPTDYLTVNRHAAQHQLILDSGGYNVAEKRGDDKLRVDDAWILRKNPGVIVKFVDRDALGAGVYDSTAAKSLYDAIAARPGWAGVSAVINNNILLLSDTLLESDAGRFIAKLYISKSLYPTLFAEVDVDTVCAQTLDAAFGSDAGGMYAWGQPAYSPSPSNPD